MKDQEWIPNFNKAVSVLSHVLLEQQLLGIIETFFRFPLYPYVILPKSGLDLIGLAIKIPVNKFLTNVITSTNLLAYVVSIANWIRIAHCQNACTDGTNSQWRTRS